MAAVPEIPIIRLDDPDASVAAQKLRTTCQKIGFFYLDGHGIEAELFADVFAQSKLLFDLSKDSKNAMADPELSRGYTAMGEETLDPTKQRTGDTKEGFYIGRQVDPSSPKYNPAKLAGPNQWPSPQKTPDMKDCEAFRKVMETYFERISNVGLRTVRLLALSLGLPAQHFDDYFSEPMAALRLLHYDAVKSRPEEGLFAAGAHSDYGMITLLLTDENSGLQVQTKSGEWVDVPPRKGSLVVNLGDMLERWTNGLYVSTPHRVLTVGDVERYSVPFFYEPNFDTKVECLPVCCSDENPARYPPTTSGQHLLDKYKQTHADFKPNDEL